MLTGIIFAVIMIGLFAFGIWGSFNEYRKVKRVRLTIPKNRVYLDTDFRFKIDKRGYDILKRYGIDMHFFTIVSTQEYNEIINKGQ